MHKHRRLTRRKLLVGLASGLSAAVVARTQRRLGLSTTRAQEPTPRRVYLPYLSSSHPGPRVVHVRDAGATQWDGAGHFSNAVNQDVVNSMLQAGLALLTGQADWAGIWKTLFEPVVPAGYSPGQKIAVKANLNNSRTCGSHPGKIDALPQPLLALISGMVAAGVEPGDITVYDAIRHTPTYLRAAVWAVYPQVNFMGNYPDQAPCSGILPPSFGVHPSLTVPFDDPDGNLSDRRLADILYQATYLINMPILKRHGGDTMNPVTLSFKNHFGSIDSIYGNGDDHLHNYIFTSHSLYEPTYSPLVDICRNPNIRDKTILVLGDGLFGSTGHSDDPLQTWDIFGGACNSLFFGRDPVATDCVMADLIVAEGLVSRTHTYDYLFYAQEVGLGVCEGTREAPGGQPLQTPYGSGYQAIEYLRLDQDSG